MRAAMSRRVRVDNPARPHRTVFDRHLYDEACKCNDRRVRGREPAPMKPIPTAIRPYAIESLPR